MTRRKQRKEFERKFMQGAQKPYLRGKIKEMLQEGVEIKEDTIAKIKQNYKESAPASIATIFVGGVLGTLVFSYIFQDQTVVDIAKRAAVSFSVSSVPYIIQRVNTEAKLISEELDKKVFKKIERHIDDLEFYEKSEQQLQEEREMKDEINELFGFEDDTREKH